MQTHDHENASGTWLIILSFSAYGWIIKMTGNEINSRSFPLADKVKYDHLHCVADWLIEGVKILKNDTLQILLGSFIVKILTMGKCLAIIRTQNHEI